MEGEVLPRGQPTPFYISTVPVSCILVVIRWRPHSPIAPATDHGASVVHDRPHGQ